MADLQEPHPLNNKPGRSREDIMKDASKSQRDINSLKKYIKELKKLQKVYKEQDKQYKLLEKDIKKLQTAEKNLIASKKTLANVANMLTSRIGSGGVSGAITSFAKEAIGATTSVDEMTGKMNILGKATGISEEAFMGWASVIQLGIKAVIALADEIDRAQIKQGNLQRAFGATNISIMESYNATVAGWETAGKAGAKAAGQLNTALRAARANVMTELGGAGSSQFKRLLQFQVGIDPNTIKRIRDLAEVFNIRTGKGMLTQLTGLYNVAIKSGLPIQMYTEMIWGLAKQFANVGITAKDTVGVLETFANAVNKQRITPGLAMKMGNLAMAQQLTAGGFQGKMLTAAFAQKSFGTLGTQTKAALNKAAANVYGQGKTFTNITAYQAANVLSNQQQVSSGTYVRAMGGVYNELKRIEGKSGYLAAEQVAQQMGIPEYREFRKAFEAVQKTGKMPSAKDIENAFSTANQTAANLAATNAQLNQQWYSEWRAAMTEELGYLASIAGKNKKSPLSKKQMETTTIPLQSLVEESSNLYLRATHKGIYNPELHTEDIDKAFSKAFAEAHGGVTPEMLNKYNEPRGAHEHGLPMYVSPSVNVPLARKTLHLDIRATMTNNPSGEPVSGTLPNE